MSGTFNYSKLKGKIKERGYTNEEFAKKIGMNPSTFSAKLHNVTEFKQSEMIKSLKALNVPISNIRLYFFCHNTSDNQSF